LRLLLLPPLLLRSRRLDDACHVSIVHMRRLCLQPQQHAARSFRQPQLPCALVADAHHIAAATDKHTADWIQQVLWVVGLLQYARV
jgi:hypothetical protein